MSRSLLCRSCTCILHPTVFARSSSSAAAFARDSPPHREQNDRRKIDIKSDYSRSSNSSPSSRRFDSSPRSTSPTFQQNHGAWKGSAPIRSKKLLEKQGTNQAPLELHPRSAAAQRNYLALDPESRRREDMLRMYPPRRGNQSRDRLYALDREEKRESASRASAGRDGQGRLELEDAKAGLPRRTTWGEVGVHHGGYSPDVDEDEKARGQRHEMRKMYKKAEHRAKMASGPAVTKTWSAKPLHDRNTVKPVVRGGAVKVNPMSGQRKVRVKPKVLRKVILPSMVRLENLTNILGVKLYTLQRSMERLGMDNIRPERLLTAEDASLVALELNFDPMIDDEAAFDIYQQPAPAETEQLPLRPPITGIFGHVDHGKTSLLDALRATTVAAGEAGGITQHIGAFEVPVDSILANLRAKETGKKQDANEKSSEEASGTITFLDTPGHAAFTAMRERGAGVTDVVVLVVAADDGVKPQTEEVIRLIQGSDVGVVVAITKCDKPGIDTTKVKQELMAAGVEVEAFGGDVPCVEVSSVTGQGLPELLETISAIAEVRELKAERIGNVEGRVIESRVEKGRGNVATVLVLRGCLQRTTSLVAGTTWCRVRSLTPPIGKDVISAFPGQPVEITGWKDLPSAGDLVLEANSEEDAKKAVANRLRRIEQDKMWREAEIINEKRRVESEIEVIRREEEAKAKAKGLSRGAAMMAGNIAVDGLESSAKDGVKELVMIIKADVSGTVEAVVGALQGIGNKEAKVKIISSAVGDVQEADIEHARAVNGCVVGFNVKASNSILKLASMGAQRVPVHTSAIIYRLVEIVRDAVADLLPRTIETRVHGEAVVQQIFEIKVKGRKDPMRIAGSKVTNGVFQKARKARVVRNGETLHLGEVSTLKQVKKDVTEISKGVECGIALDGWEEFEPLDVIQSIEEIEHRAVL